MTTAEGLTYDQDGNLIEVYLPGDIDRDGDVGNYAFRTMESVGEWLYTGTATFSDALEVSGGRSPD